MVWGKYCCQGGKPHGSRKELAGHTKRETRWEGKIEREKGVSKGAYKRSKSRGKDCGVIPMVSLLLANKDRE